MFSELQRCGVNVQWISNEKEKHNCGYDLIVNGKTVEIKSNQYIRRDGKIVIEISDKTSWRNEAKWMGGNTDILLFVERTTGAWSMYDARRLARELKDKTLYPKFLYRNYNGADCLHVPFQNAFTISSGVMQWIH